jgi:RNA polymerase sigma factor (sigma-70 family)
MTIYKNCTDQELLAKLRDGDRLAFDEIYDKHWEVVYAQAFKKIHEPDTAKDITQDVFIYLWIHRADNYIDNLPAYLFSAVRNNVFKLLKREERFIPITDLLLEVKVHYAEADSVVLEREFFKSYDALINAMPKSQQMIYRMRYHDHLSTADIAAQLNISRKTVQNQLTRAVALLRASLLSIAFVITHYR